MCESRDFNIETQISSLFFFAEASNRVEKRFEVFLFHSCSFREGHVRRVGNFRDHLYFQLDLKERFDLSDYEYRWDEPDTMHHDEYCVTSIAPAKQIVNCSQTLELLQRLLS